MRFPEPRCSRAAAIALIAAGLAGCSTDTRRFGETSLANPPPPSQSAPIGRVDSQPLYSESAGSLPPPPPPVEDPGDYARRDTTGSIAAARSGWSSEGGTAITVAPGDTLDLISRRYGVPPGAIIEANRMPATGAISPGQRLVIPRYHYAVRQTRPGTPSSPPKQARVAPGGVHVVARGETLSSIAHRYGKSRFAIAKANNIAPDAKMRIGQRLVIPGPKPVRAAAASSVHAPAPVAGSHLFEPSTASPQPLQRVATADAGPAAGATAEEPRAPHKVAGLEASGPAPDFRWPVRGRIIAPFAAEANGQRNDGINLAVPEGTSVKAADEGTVAYAGNELKGYGNLILVRHNNGFVTAYAHASELMVKRGDQVKRGQIIARAGQTGNVASPQLHFEIRKGATPVDPTRYLSGT